MNIRQPSRCLFACLLAGSAAGCALYHSKPLPTGPDLQGVLQPLNVDVSKMHLPGLKPHPFDPARGLDMTDVAILAVVNNPALRTARAQAHAGEAQAFVAGMLPGPEINYSLDHPTHQDPQYVNAHSVGLAYELTALVTHGAAQGAARATAKQVNLDLLWQEWQVAQQSRILYVDCLTNERKLSLLTRLRDGIQQRYRAEQRAVTAGNLALDSLSLDLAALQDVEQRATAISTARNLSCSSLNEVLGLKPDVVLKLVPGRKPVNMPAAGVLTEALKDLPQRRPDLLALRYGYQSQDQEVWRAVLAQFPGISFGINRAQDTSDVHTTGFSLSVNFPFLSGGAAAVHAAEASRDALWAQYQQRLDEAVSQVHLIDTDLGILDKEYTATRRSEADARHLYSSAGGAYSRGDLSAPAYYELTIAAVNRELASLDLLSQRQQLRIALETLLGLPPQDFVLPIQEPSS